MPITDRPNDPKLSSSNDRTPSSKKILPPNQNPRILRIAAFFRRYRSRGMSHDKNGAKQFIPSSPLSTIIPENYHSEPIVRTHLSDLVPSSIIREVTITTLPMSPLTVQLPDHLIAALSTLNSPPQQVIIQALETYLQNHNIPLERVRTWQLCGKFDIAPSATPQQTTNYAEQVDTALYDSLSES